MRAVHKLNNSEHPKRAQQLPDNNPEPTASNAALLLRELWRRQLPRPSEQQHSKFVICHALAHAQSVSSVVLTGDLQEHTAQEHQESGQE